MGNDRGKSPKSSKNTIQTCRMELKGSQSIQLVRSPCPESLRTFWQLWEIILYWKVIFRFSGSPKSTFWHHRGICKMTNFQTLPVKIEVSAVKSLEFGLYTLRVVYSIKFSACFDKFEVLFGWGKHPPISLTFVTFAWDSACTLLSSIMCAKRIQIFWLGIY